MTKIPLCGDCGNDKICVRPRYQDNCLLHTEAEKYFTYKVLEEVDKILDWRTELMEELYKELRNPDVALHSLQQIEIIRSKVDELRQKAGEQNE